MGFFGTDSFMTGNGIALFAMLVLSADAIAQDVSHPFHERGVVLDTPGDLKDTPIAPKLRGFLPQQVDLSNLMPAPGNQGAQGSCTAWAVGYAARAYYASKIENRSLRDPANIPSPRYIYAAIKSGNGCDEGTSIAKALRLLRDRGAGSLRQYPYSPNQCSSIQPDSTDFRIDGFNWINPENLTSDQLIDQMKGELSQGNPVVISMRVTDAFDRLQGNEIYRNPTSCSRSDTADGLCYHAMTIVGYDDRRQAFKLINSWGRSWGDKGFGFVSYPTLAKELGMGYVLRVDPAPTPLPVPTCGISVSPESIVEGQQATLAFRSSDAEGGAIDNGIGIVPKSGSRTISPSTSTVYVGTFQGQGGIGICRAAVQVTPRPTPKPVIAGFSSDKLELTRGQTAMLSWSVAGVVSVSVDGQTVSEKGTLEVAPKSTTTYTLKATNSGGDVESAVTIVVKDAPDIVLPTERCGKVSSVRQRDKRLIAGFVGTVSDLQWVLQNAGDDEVQVDVRPWPQCEILATLEKAITLGHSDSLDVRIQKASGQLLKEDDPLVFEITTPSYPVFLHVAYVQADGSVANLTKPLAGRQTPRPPRTKVIFGAGDNSGRFSIGSPFGAEMLIVLASREPLFVNARPDLETDRDFLTAIQRLIENTSGAGGIVAGYETIVTAKE